MNELLSVSPGPETSASEYVCLSFLSGSEVLRVAIAEPLAISSLKLDVDIVRSVGSSFVLLTPKMNDLS